MNVCTILGNLVADPETRQAGDKTVVNFAVAVNGRDKDNPLYLDCTAWEKTGELIAQFFEKGDRICVSGELRQDRWEDQEGNNRSKIKLTVRSWSFASNKGESRTGSSEKLTPEEVPF